MQQKPRKQSMNHNLEIPSRLKGRSTGKWQDTNDTEKIGKNNNRKNLSQIQTEIGIQSFKGMENSFKNKQINKIKSNSLINNIKMNVPKETLV